ncbi:MAG TPA: YciI family protein [Usitatibacter sp.]|nr:YciI family protein [Usitatibacter sp.]
MTEFVLLYRISTEQRRAAMGTPEAAQQNMKKWRAWMDEMSRHGQLKNVGQPLDDGGKVVVGTRKSIIDGPYAETKDLIGGYSVVEAPDIEQAAKIASGCPILESGGSVEVRPVRRFEP